MSFTLPPNAPNAPFPIDANTTIYVYRYPPRSLSSAVKSDSPSQSDLDSYASPRIEGQPPMPGTTPQGGDDQQSLIPPRYVFIDGVAPEHSQQKDEKDSSSCGTLFGNLLAGELSWATVILCNLWLRPDLLTQGEILLLTLNAYRMGFTLILATLSAMIALDSRPFAWVVDRTFSIWIVLLLASFYDMCTSGFDLVSICVCYLIGVTSEVQVRALYRSLFAPLLAPKDTKGRPRTTSDPHSPSKPAIDHPEKFDIEQKSGNVKREEELQDVEAGLQVPGTWKQSRIKSQALDVLFFVATAYWVVYRLPLT